MPFWKKKQKSPKRRLEAGSPHLNKSNLSLGEAADTDSGSALVKLKLGGHELVFKDGEWIAENSQGSGGISAETTKLKKQHNQLKEENNYLKYKIDVLLDMLAVTTADCNVLEKELETIQNQKRVQGTAR